MGEFGLTPSAPRKNEPLFSVASVISVVFSTALVGSDHYRIVMLLARRLAPMLQLLAISVPHDF